MKMTASSFAPGNASLLKFELLNLFSVARNSASSPQAVAEPLVHEPGTISPASREAKKKSGGETAAHPSRLSVALILLLLTAGALLVEGYHPWAEDAEIYLPGIEKILQPELFPFNAQFFQSHAHLTLFPNLVAEIAVFLVGGS